LLHLRSPARQSLGLVGFVCRFRTYHAAGGYRPKAQPAPARRVELLWALLCVGDASNVEIHQCHTGRVGYAKVSAVIRHAGQWCAAVQFTAAYDNVFAFLRDHYALAIERLDGFTASIADLHVPELQADTRIASRRPRNSAARALFSRRSIGQESSGLLIYWNLAQLSI
jgi:hypothetical protein